MKKHRRALLLVALGLASSPAWGKASLAFMSLPLEDRLEVTHQAVSMGCATKRNSPAAAWLWTKDYQRERDKRRGERGVNFYAAYWELLIDMTGKGPQGVDCKGVPLFPKELHIDQ